MANSEIIGAGQNTVHRAPKINTRKRFLDRSNECRIAITTECNISCPYCINQFNAVKTRFRFERMEEVVRHKYKTYNITGGEPFLECSKLRRICVEIRRHNPSSSIVVYTNGYSNEIIPEIDKYFLGCHLGFYRECLNRLIQIRRCFPDKYIELMVEQNTYHKHNADIDAVIGLCSNVFIWTYDPIFNYSSVRPKETFYIV